jgi:hypothetical protein
MLPKKNRNYIIVTELGLLLMGLMAVGYVVSAIVLAIGLFIVLIKIPSSFHPIDATSIKKYLEYSFILGVFVLIAYKFFSGNIYLLMAGVPYLIAKEILFYKKVWKPAI